MPLQVVEPFVPVPNREAFINAGVVFPSFSLGGDSPICVIICSARIYAGLKENVASVGAEYRTICSGADGSNSNSLTWLTDVQNVNLAASSPSRFAEKRFVCCRGSKSGCSRGLLNWSSVRCREPSVGAIQRSAKDIGGLYAGSVTEKTAHFRPGWESAHLRVSSARHLRE